MVKVEAGIHRQGNQRRLGNRDFQPDELEPLLLPDFKRNTKCCGKCRWIRIESFWIGKNAAEGIRRCCDRFHKRAWFSSFQRIVADSDYRDDTADLGTTLLHII